jgi:DNA repair protein RadC
VRIADYRDPTNTNLIGASKVLGQEGWSNATAIIISHNNPSGDPTPSPEDIALTKAMVKAGQMLDMEVLDHVVVGRGRFVSLKARGLGFDEK